MSVRLTVYPVRIPMRYRFGHAKASRQLAENVIVRVELADGAVGWGEGVPREYVTGETPRGAVALLRSLDLAPLAPPVSASFAESVRFLWELDLAEKLAPLGAANAAACALETALLDAYARREGRPLLDALTLVAEPGELRSPPAKAVRQTLTIADDLESALERAGQPTLPLELKLKVGFGLERDRQRLAALRARFGEEADLRLDANGAWTLDEAVETLVALRQAGGFSSVEEPLRDRDLAGCARLRRQTGALVMLDESLCCLEHGRRALEIGAADLFNLRLSKNGGVLGSLRMVRLARAAGIAYQLGCMVGESGILASLGRGFVSRVAGARHFESTVPARSLEADLTDAPLALDLVTRLTAAPDGPGFGAALDEAALARYAE